MAAAFLAAGLAALPGPARAEDLISGIGLTRLAVYDQRPAPDGQMSGSPHVHAVTDEGYYVMSGQGKVELHDLRDGFRSVDLRPGPDDDPQFSHGKCPFPNQNHGIDHDQHNGHDGKGTVAVGVRYH